MGKGRWIGRWLLFVATVHTLFGLVVFWDAVEGIADVGFLYAVEVGSDFFGPYFFILWGALCYVLGFTVDALERQRDPYFPVSIGLSLALFTVVSIVISPVSGFWTLIPAAIALLRRAS